ncbi:hypothetical protein D8B46_06330 [Candidatus Gracilibacteria bacterium]|nr:hypothetical protein [Candidatus Gracilibacteria bacterium]MBF0913999.1 hypothetical protein [Candidatus Gracilibacteria bacterium]RKW21987.1 MAG: hypothetical protein D8B46_06330 [Candidatus Gracilibacteria bacterium]
MIFDFLKKRKKIEQRINMINDMFVDLKIPESQKALYIQALDILDEDGINRIYDELTNFVKNLELKNLEDIQKNNFSVISGMKLKEAEERKEELNSFNFLINKL